MRTSFVFLFAAAVFMPATLLTLAQPSGVAGLEPPWWVAASSGLPKAGAAPGGHDSSQGEKR